MAVDIRLSKYYILNIKVGYYNKNNNMKIKKQKKNLKNKKGVKEDMDLKIVDLFIVGCCLNGNLV